MQPLIVTLVLDDQAQRRFEENVPAALHEQAARPPLAVRVTAARSLGPTWEPLAVQGFSGAQ